MLIIFHFGILCSKQTLTIHNENEDNYMYLHLGSCMGHPSKYISITKPSYFAESFNTILKCTYFLKVLQRSSVQMLRFASKLLCDMVWGRNERQTCEPIHASFLLVETHLIRGWHTFKNLVILIQCPEVMEALCTSTSFHADFIPMSPQLIPFEKNWSKNRR